MFSYLLPLFIALWLAVVGLDFFYQRCLRELYPDIAAGLHPGWFRKSMASDLKATGFLIRGITVGLETARLSDSVNFIA